MAHVQKGDTVKVHYTGKLDDGTVFDTSRDRETLEFTLGEGQLIPGFEDAVVGMSPGESRTVTIPQEQAYGSYQEEAVMNVPREQFPGNLNPEIGQQLQIQQENGQVFLVRITDVAESAVTLDANHPLAGQDLTFDIQLIDIVE